MPDQILATGDNLAKKAASGPLKDVLKEIGDAATSHPSIYVRQLTVGKDKDDLTVEQAERIVMFIKQYTDAQPSKNDEHFTVDKKLRADWKREWTDKGFRALLVDVNGKPHAYKKRVLQTFGRTMKKAVDEAKAAGRTHIRSKYYVGYAKNAAARERQHAKKDAGSNWLINYTEFLLELWWPKLEVSARMYPVCLLSGETFADVAECILCRVACGYYYAGGYNIDPCGSVTSVSGISEADWAIHRLTLEKTFGFEQQLRKELALRKVYRRKPYEDKVAALKKEDERLRAGEAHIHKAYNSLRKDLDLDHMRQNEFLQQFLPAWEKLEKFVDDTPQK